MKEGLTSHTVIRNATLFDYGLEEAVESVIDVSDYYIILEAYSEDDTLDRCMTLKEKHHPKLKVIRGDWESPKDTPGHQYLRLSRLTNQCIDACETKWSLCVQADEAYHELGLEGLRLVVEGKTGWDEPPRACAFRFVHLVGNPWTQFPFLYSAGLRMARTDSTWRSAVDAAGYKYTSVWDNNIAWMQYPVCFHYGKLGHSMKKLQKQADFERLFTAKGFPDPKVQELVDAGEGMSYAYLFQDAKDKGLFTPFEGTHPAVMKDWLESHAGHWETFTE